MRLRVVWFALMAASLCLGQARADDFDDDFAQPKPRPTQPAPKPASAPAASPSPGSAGALAPPPPKPAPASPYAAFDDGDEPMRPPESRASRRAQVRTDDVPPGAEVRTERPPVMPAQHYRDDAASMPHGTLTGLVGGLHLVDGASGPVRTFRVAITGRLFRKDGYVYQGDQHRRLSSFLTLGVTPIEHLEIAASLAAYATENNTASPKLVQALGDTTLSAKGYGTLLPGLSVAGALEVVMLNGTGGAGFQASATGVGLRGVVSYDMRDAASKLPIVLRSNLRYLFDNSSRLIEDVEAGRYAALNDAAPSADEYRHLVSTVERYQLQVNRVDTFSLGFGAEFPIQIAKHVDVRPLLEWQVALPVNRQDYDCLISNDPGDIDSCLAREGFSARHSAFTFGVRGEPGIRGLSVLLAVDVATGGSQSFVRELAPSSRYELTAGLSYAYDVRPPRPIVIEKEIVPEPPPERGRVTGVVVDKEGGQPVARAIVHVQGSSTSDLATDADGKFTSEPLEVGAYPLAVSHEDYHDGTCSAELTVDELTTNVRCELAPKPRFASVRGRVSNPEGAPIAGASVELRGPTTRTLTTDGEGAFAAADLAEGAYEARAEAPGYLLRATPFDAKTKQEANLSLVLMPVPKERLTELKTQNITIKRQVQFVADSAEISEKSSALLAEIADLLLRNPQVARVEVQGHTDYTGTPTYNQELSQSRAEAVRSALIAAGVEGKRLTAVGYGRSRPIAPNITEANRAKNRRVDFVILETQ